jgi:glycosyltransferase involved in cell wall biosynthesis
LRVLHFLWALESGGSENLAVDLANYQSLKHDVIVMVGNDAVDPAVASRLDPRVRLVVVGRPAGSRNPYWVIRLLLTVHSLRPDVIHSHSHDLGFLGRLISAPTILTVHTVNVDLSRSWSSYRRICCISKAVLLDINKRFPTLSACQVDNGIVTSKVATTPVRTLSPVLRGVQVSRLVHETKGQDLLIKAMAVFNSVRSTPAMTIDFIGDGPSLGYLRQLADELVVSKYCNFLGALGRDDVYTRLCDYDLLIQPSRYEGFGLTVAEGMAAGIPVLVSDIEGPMEIIRAGEYGYHFASDNVIALASALDRMVGDIRSGVSATKALSARQFVSDTYSLPRTADHYVQIYEEVAGV